MSSWLEEQRAEALILYRHYNGMRLHFKEGSVYDYSKYSGGVNISIEAFSNKPIEVSNFFRLKNKLVNIPHEEYLFANARYSNWDIHNTKAMIIYKRWHQAFGSKERFNAEICRLMKLQTGIGDNVVDIATNMIKSNDDDIFEVIVWILQRNPGILDQIKANCEDIIFNRMTLLRIIKIQKMYSYFCII